MSSARSPQPGRDRRHKAGTLGVAQPRPGALVEGVPSGAHRAIYIRRLRLGHPEAGLLGMRVDDVYHRLARRRHPLAADVEPVRTSDRYHQGSHDVFSLQPLDPAPAEPLLFSGMTFHCTTLR